MEIIKSSYRTLMLKLRQHPDLGGGHWNAALINEAYSVLTNPSKRVEYDRLMHLHPDWHHSKRHRKNQPRHKGPSPSPVPGNVSKIKKNQCPFCATVYSVRLKTEPQAECSVCHSPLFEVRHLERERKSNRTIGRVEQYGLIAFYTHWPQSQADRGTIHDLSPYGIQFTTTKTLHKGQVIKLSTDAMHAISRIACCIPCSGGARHPFRIGAEFITLRFNHATGTFVSAEV
ncbi:MAG: J domain-containing protein [Gammaproteobacteria bacterium]|nr:J domain-containing protein [Gammaproteobacteria bacterium]